MKIILMSGSLRNDSLNKKVILNAESILKEQMAGEILITDLKAMALPVYDGDIESKGIPAAVTDWGEQLNFAQALIVSTPEYNGSIASPLKNALDWVSRIRPVPLNGKQVLLMGASPGALGAIRGLWHTRVPFEALGCHVYPEMLGIPQADKVFDPSGQLSDEAVGKKLRGILEKFVNHLKKFNS